MVRTTGPSRMRGRLLPALLVGFVLGLLAATQMLPRTACKASAWHGPTVEQPAVEQPAVAQPAERAGWAISKAQWDLAASAGRDLSPKLRKCSVAATPAQPPAQEEKRRLRWDEDSLKQYTTESKHWEGWLQHEALTLMAYMTKQQRNAGVWGASGEIGVHHGRFTAPIFGFSSLGETLWAADLFGAQGENVDKSGKGNLDAFQKNLDSVGVGKKAGAIIAEQNSLRLTSEQLMRDVPGGFRMLSVDGGHTHDTTLSDLLLACEVMVDGGIVILDDFVHPFWLGVATGAMEAMRSQDRLVPFLWSANKLFLTTASHHERYLKSLDEINHGLCHNHYNNDINKKHIFPAKICILDCAQRMKAICEPLKGPSVLHGSLEWR